VYQASNFITELKQAGKKIKRMKEKSENKRENIEEKRLFTATNAADLPS